MGTFPELQPEMGIDELQAAFDRARDDGLIPAEDARQAVFRPDISTATRQWLTDFCEAWELAEFGPDPMGDHHGRNE